MAFKLVSCDGGGIRGYLTCLILQSLHEETGFLDKADGFAGTSTGGLIAVALADGRTQGKDMAALIAELAAHYRGDADLIFQENERSFLDRALDRVLQKPEETAELARRGLERVRSGYTWDEVARRTEEFYYDVLAGGHRSEPLGRAA